MQMFRDELASAKTSQDKLRARMWALRKFIFWHYVLLLLSLIQSGLVLYVIINMDVPNRGWLFLSVVASILLSCSSLFSGISK